MAERWNITARSTYAGDDPDAEVAITVDVLAHISHQEAIQYGIDALRAIGGADPQEPGDGYSVAVKLVDNDNDGGAEDGRDQVQG